MVASDGLTRTSLVEASRVAYRLQALRFRYRGPRQERELARDEWVLRDVTCDIRGGEVVGIVGPNGSGKTSLLKLLARVTRPQVGGVRLFGRDLAGMSQQEIARTVAFVPQENPQVFPFTVAETVMMGRFPHGRTSFLGGVGWETPEDWRLADQAMVETGITHVSDRLLAHISGGERQRAIIARALVQQSQVLLLDEPTAYLDLHHQVEICQLLRRFNEERGLTVVLASHDLNLASQYCDRLLVLKGGEIQAEGPPAEVLRPDLLNQVYACDVLVDRHPDTGLPRVTLPGRAHRAERIADD